MEAQDIDLINTAHRVNISNSEIEKEIAKNRAITDELCEMSAQRGGGSGDVSARGDMKHEDILMSPAHRSGTNLNQGIESSNDKGQGENVKGDKNTKQDSSGCACCVKCVVC